MKIYQISNAHLSYAKNLKTQNARANLYNTIPELQNDEELKAHPDYQTRYAFSGEEIKFDSDEAKEVFSYFENHPFKYCGYVERYSFE